MARSFQDHDFLIWEAYPSGGAFGFDDDVKIVFHCLTDRRRRPRFVQTADDSADAAQIVEQASAEELLAMLERAEALR